MKGISREGNCLLAIAKDNNRECVMPADIADALRTNPEDKVQDDLLEILAFFLEVEVNYPMVCILLANKELILTGEELREFS
jgi:hypothetical protein